MNRAIFDDTGNLERENVAFCGIEFHPGKRGIVSACESLAEYDGRGRGDGRRIEFEFIDGEKFPRNGEIGTDVLIGTQADDTLALPPSTLADTEPAYSAHLGHANEQLPLVDAHAAATAAGASVIEFRSLFDILRRPYA